MGGGGGGSREGVKKGLYPGSGLVKERAFKRNKGRILEQA